MTNLKTLNNTKKNIRYLIHLADIHIRRTNEKLEEYKQVFANLEKDLLDRDFNEDNSLIIICGDIFHDKELLSPISVELCKDFFNMLSTITNILLLPGNHDIVENNQTINSLKAVISKYFQSKNKIYYIDENCNYIYNNLIISNTNVFTNKVTEYIQTDKYSDKILIQTYHGIILGCQNESNSFLGDDKNFRVGDFRKYNKDGYILLGDIHKHQYLDKKCAYSGSLIQQNKGESTEKGYILWDLEKDKSKFIKIHNDYGYIKVTIDKDGKTNLNELENIPKYTKLNIISKSTNLEHIDNFCKIINKKSNIIEKNQYFDMTENNLNTTIEVNGKQNNLSLTNKDSLYNLLIDGIKKIDNNITKSIEQKIKCLIDDIKFVDISVKNIKLKILKFNNFMKYGENNMIDFEKFNDFYAIFAKNSTGKSTLYDCILYSVFGQSSRGSAYDLINKDSKTMETEITLTVNDKEYKIIRKISKNNDKAQTIKTELLNIFENNVNIAYDVRKSSKIIEEKICTYEEFVRNSIVAQHIDVNFMNLSPKDKIIYLSKISRLEVIKQITHNCNTILRSYKREYTQNLNKVSKYKEYDLVGKNNLAEIKYNIDNKLKAYCEKKQILIQDNKKINNDITNIDKNINIKENDISNLQIKIKEIKTGINNDYLMSDSTEYEHKREELIKEKEYIEFTLETLEYKKILLYCDIQIGEYEQVKKIFDNKQLKKIEEIHKRIKSKQKLLWNDTSFIYNNYNKKNINENIDTSKEIIKEYIIKKEKAQEQLNKLKIIINKKIIKINFDNENYTNNLLIKDKIENNIEQLNNELLIYTKSYRDLENHKYDPKCKYCIENSITKQKLLIEKMINQKNTDIKQNNIKLKDLIKLIEEQQQTKIKYDEYINNITYINDAKNEIDELNRNIELYMMKIEREENVIKNNEDILKKIKLYENNRIINNEIDNEYNKIDEIKNTVCEEYNKYLEMNKEYNKILEDIDCLNKKLIKINKDYDYNNKLIDECNKHEDDNKNMAIMNNNILKIYCKINEFIKIKNTLCDKLINNELELNKIDTIIIKCNIDKESYENLFIELEKQNKDNNEYEIISKFVCDDELITKILKNNIIPQIERLINNILLNCSSYQLSFQFYKDNIDIYKKENGSNSLTNIATCGGFERHTLNLLFRIVFSQITGLIKMNYIIIDEAFDSSDIANKEKIKSIIDYMKLKYKWGIIISHDCYVKDNFDKEINIQQKDDKPYINM